MGLFSVTWVSLAILALLASRAFSISRRALDRPATATTGFRVALSHVDSNANFTRFERLQRGMKRGKIRLQRLSALALSSSNEGVAAHVQAGSGEFLMQLEIGTPPEKFSAIMDTGSDLIWTQCKPCVNCFEQSTPIFTPTKSKSYSKLPCSSPLCKALPSSACVHDCIYVYTYGDYSSTQGYMATETFTFGESHEAVSLHGIGFGCGVDNEGDGFAQGAGVVGLGRGPLSLGSQLEEPKFSYCLNSIDDTESSSSLLMGSLASVNATTSKAKLITTPLIQNPVQPTFYYISLEGITVGKTRLPIKKSQFALRDDGAGGMIIDSGTTITYIEDAAFDQVKRGLEAQTDLEVDDSGKTGLDLCFKLPSDASHVEIPKMVLHFDGGDLNLPVENYMIADTSLGVVCLAMGRSSGMSVFGNVQQQNMLVTYDLKKETLSFLHTKCSNL